MICNSAVYDLPDSLEIGGIKYEIRTDFRAILDICIALNDAELGKEQKALAALEIFYSECEMIPAECLEEALKKCYWFIDGGESWKNEKKALKLVDWEQDFKLIIAPVNRVLGYEAREIPYNPKTNIGGLHWWTFLNAFMEIGDCTFAQVVRLRDRMARGKTLDSIDKEFYQRNHEIVDLKNEYTSEEKEQLNVWFGKRTE